MIKFLLIAAAVFVGGPLVLCILAVLVWCGLALLSACLYFWAWLFCGIINKPVPTWIKDFHSHFEFSDKRC